jgi:hypothetical protein
MTRAEWEEAFARALVDCSFRARLLADPAETLSDYGLDNGQRELIASLRPYNLEGFVALVRQALPELRYHPFDPFDTFGSFDDALN